MVGKTRRVIVVDLRGILMPIPSSRTLRHPVRPAAAATSRAVGEEDPLGYLQGALAPLAGLWPARVVDLGCGRRMGDPLWQTLFEPLEPDELDYEGFDVCPARQAQTVSPAQFVNPRNRRRLGTAMQVLPRLETDGYELVLALDGVMTHAPPRIAQQILRELGRIAAGRVVLGFPAPADEMTSHRSQEGPCRAGARLASTPGYRPDAVHALLNDAGFDVIDLRSFHRTGTGAPLIAIANTPRG